MAQPIKPPVNPTPDELQRRAQAAQPTLNNLAAQETLDAFVPVPQLDKLPPVPVITDEQINEAIAKGDVDLALKLNSLREILTKQAADRARLKTKLAEQKQQLLAIQNQLDLTAARQEQCPHQKENGHPALVAVKDGQNHYQWICLRCQKQWIDQEVPFHLRAGNPNAIGGVNN